MPAPPEEAIFTSKDDLIHSLRSHAIKEGYMISIRDSRPSGYTRFRCDRGRKPQKEYAEGIGVKRRCTSTRSTQCPFMVSASNVDGDWCLKVVNSNHNHAGSTNMAAHPLARRMQDSEAAVVNTGIALGQSARLIMASLRQSHSENLTVRKDVYNARQKLRSEQLAGRSPIQFLKDQLTEKGWPFTFFQNAEGHVERLFFAHPTGLSLARQYPEVFVLDNTYKTNMYGMPLFHIVGIIYAWPAANDKPAWLSWWVRWSG
jgi:hypothetical protein